MITAGPGARYSRRRLLRVATLGPLGAALLAACGGSGAATGTTSGGASVSASASLSTGSTSAASSTAPGTTAGATTAASSGSATMSAAAGTTTSSASAAASKAGPKPTPTPASGETRKGAGTTVERGYGWGGATEIHTWETLGAKMGTELTAFNVHWLTANNNTKLLTAIAGGTPPDVAVGNAPYPEFWARGAAVPLDDMIAKSKVVNKTDIPQASWAYASYKGKTYGVPAIEAFVRYGLCLDMTNLAKLNVDPKTLSWDWDTLTQMQQQLTQKAANGSVSVIGIDPLDSMGGAFGGGNPFYWGQAWGIEYFDEQNNTFNFDNAQLVDAMTTVKKVYDIAGGAQAVAGFHNSYGTWATSPTSAFPSGVEDMQIDGYWDAGWVAHSAPGRQFAYTWPAVPAARKGFKFQSTGGHSAFLPKGAKHPAEAFQLIEYLVGDSAAQTIFDGSGFLGARLSFLSKVDASKYPGLDFFINTAKQNDKLNSIPSNPIESYTSTQWGTALQNVLYGKVQPKDALQQLQQQVTNELKQRFPNG